MAEQNLASASVAEKDFYHSLQAQTGADVSEASTEFRQALMSVISNLSFSPTLKIFGPYATAFGMIQNFALFQSKTLNPNTIFGVMPVLNPKTNEFCYSLVGDEAGLWQIVAPQTAAVEKMTPEEHQQMTTYSSILKVYQNEYGKTAGLSKLTSALRFVLLHEVGHIMLAHYFRKYQLAERFGVAISQTLSSESTDPKVEALRQFCDRSVNIVGDAYINEGLSVFWNSSEQILKTAVESVFKDDTTVSGNLTEEVRHLYDFNPEVFQDRGVFSEYFHKYLTQAVEEFPDLNAAAQTLLQKIQEKTFVADTIEEDALILIWSAGFRRLAENRCPECGSSMGSQSESQKQQSLDGTPNDEKSQSATQNSDASGTQNSSGAQNSSGTQNSSDSQEAGTSQKQTRASDASSGCSCCQRAQQQLTTTHVTVGDASGQMVVDVTVDANGNIVSIQPASASGKPVSAKDLENMSTSTARKLVEECELAAEALTDEERQRFRGFGSVLGRSIRKITEQEFPWNQILQSFVASLPAAATKPSWISPVRALKRLGYHYPDDAPTTSLTDYSLLFLIDASGSVSNTELKQALGAILTAAKNGISQLYVVAHDSDVGNISSNSKLLALAKRCGADRKVLQNYNVLKIKTADASRQKNKLLQLLKAFADSLPAGGTSHVNTLRTLNDTGFSRNELRSTKLSGIVCFTDCYSDLEQLPPEVDTLAKLSNTDAKKLKVAIVNSNKSHAYSHDSWPVLTVSGQVSEPTQKKASRSK